MEIQDYSNYLIYEDGTLYNKKTKNYIKSHKNKNGYLYNCLTKNSKSKFKLNHRLVALAYISNPNEYNDIDHIDSDRTNNNVNNLRWCNRSMNNEYKKSKNYFKQLGGFTVAITRSGVKHRKWFKKEQDAIEWRDKILELYSK